MKNNSFIPIARRRAGESPAHSRLSGVRSTAGHTFFKSQMYANAREQKIKERNFTRSKNKETENPAESAVLFLQFQLQARSSRNQALRQMARATGF